MKAVINYIPQMWKAIMPLAVGGVLWLLAQVGVTPEMTVETAVTVLAGSVGSAVAVWAKANK